MDYDMTYNGGDFMGGAMWIFIILYIAIIALVIISWWKIFEKAGKPGWAAIVPFYNLYMIIEIVGRPSWWIWIFVGGIIIGMIPFIGWLVLIGVFVFGVMLVIDLAKSFGKDVGFAIGLLLLGVVFYPILAFGSAQYIGPAAAQNNQISNQ